MMTTFALTIGDETVQSDSLTDLVGALIDGYPRSGDEGDLLEDRWRCAVLHADAAQARLLAQAVDGGDVHLPSLPEEQLQTLLVSRSGRVPVPGDRWEQPVPLVLIATEYRPYTTAPVPAGNVLLIDPGNERTLLGSLADLGACSLHVRDDETDAR